MKKVLVIRFSSIGDIVLTTPVLRGLAQQLSAEVHVLTKPSFASILDPNPNVYKVWLLSEDWSAMVNALKQENFDVVIDLHSNLRSYRLKQALGKPTHTFYKANIPKYLMVQFKMNYLPDVHIVDRYMATVKPLGVVPDGQGLDYFIPASDEVDIHAQMNWEEHQQYLAVVIGAAHFTKQVPEEKLLDWLRDYPLPVLLIGGKKEQALGQRIEEAYKNKVRSLAGNLSIHQSASIIQQAALVLTPDTGMMHIAAAFQKKIISVWGNTIPEFGMYPYYGNTDSLEAASEEPKLSIIENKNLSCRPCSKIGYAKCPRGHFKCMMELQNPL